MKPSEKIKEIRKKLTLTQKEFAEKLDAKENTIINIENNKQSIPDDLALALESEYKIPFKWWKTGQGSMSLANEESQKESKEEIIRIIIPKNSRIKVIIENE